MCIGVLMTEEPHREPGRVARFIGALGALGLFKAIERAERQKAVPGVVTGNPKIEALADAAWTIAEEEPDAATAVEAVLRKAHGRKTDLLRAAAIVRMDGAGESRIACRADRLLHAAATGSAVVETSEESAWFDE